MALERSGSGTDSNTIRKPASTGGYEPWKAVDGSTSTFFAGDHDVGPWVRN